MSDSVKIEPLSHEEVLAAVADLVVSVDQVVRLEPTVRNRLRQLSADPATAIRGTRPPEGVALKQVGLELDVIIEVAVRPGRAAAETAEDIQHQVKELLLASGCKPGSITVSVLALERP